MEQTCGTGILLLTAALSDGGKDHFKITSAIFLSPPNHHHHPGAHKCKENDCPSATLQLPTAHREAGDTACHLQTQTSPPTPGEAGQDLSPSLTSQYNKADSV